MSKFVDINGLLVNLELVYTIAYDDIKDYIIVSYSYDDGKLIYVKATKEQFMSVRNNILILNKGDSK